MSAAPELGEVAPEPLAAPRRGRFPTLIRPPGIGFHLLLAIPMAAWLYATSSPGGADRLLAGLTLLLVPILVVVWVARLVGWILAWRRGRGAGGGWRFVVAPAMAALAVVLLATGAPITIRWGLSRSAFEREVATLQVSPPTAPAKPPHSLGLYHVDHVDRHGREFVFSLGNEFLDENGVVYAPDGAAAGRRVVREAIGFPAGWWPLGNGWYAFSVST